MRRVSLETQHTFGAIGYAEEHEAPRHFKRVHLDTIALGGATEARRGIAAFLLDHGGARPAASMISARRATRCASRRSAGWRINWSGDRKADFDARPFSKREFDAEFARDIGQTGWIGLGWSKEFGGQARSPHGADRLHGNHGAGRGAADRGRDPGQRADDVRHAGHSSAKYLPEILRGEAMHGMGYSEPQAGSDLAALRTSAVRDGDSWVISGQKIWTTTWWGKYMFLAARTDPKAKPPHAGISMFIVPMDDAGHHDPAGDHDV